MNPLWWIFVLFVGGLLLMAIDVVVPSGGALISLAGVAFITSIVMSFSESTALGLSVFAGETVFISVLVVIFIKWWPNSPLGRRILIQRSRIDAPEEKNEDEPDKRDLVGVVGIAKTKLLPAGSVSLFGKRYDAISDGTPIEAGQVVEVVAVDMNRIVVRPSNQQVSSTKSDSPQSPIGDPLSQSIEDLGLGTFDDPLS